MNIMKKIICIDIIVINAAKPIFLYFLSPFSEFGGVFRWVSGLWDFFF